MRRKTPENRMLPPKNQPAATRLRIVRGGVVTERVVGHAGAFSLALGRRGVRKAPHAAGIGRFRHPSFDGAGSARYRRVSAFPYGHEGVPVSESTIGIIMNGVSGRMGYRQHLVRSILAIREQGGVLLRRRHPRAGRADPRRPQRGQARRARRQARHRELHDRPRRRARRPALADLRRLPRDEGARRPPSARRSPPARRSTPRSPPPRPSRRPSSSPASPRRPASRTASCTTSSTCPGCSKLKRLIDSGFFGRILSVRGEFGYWVFEGDWQAAQRPSWNYRARGRRRHRRRHVPALELRAREPVRPRRVRLRPRRHAHPRRASTSTATPTRPPPTTPPTRSSSSRAASSRSSTRAGPCGSTATSSSSSRSTARSAAPSSGCSAAKVQPRNATPEAGLEPRPRRRRTTTPPTGSRCPTTTCSRTASRRSGRSSSATSSRTRPHAYDFLAGARGVLLAEAGPRELARGPPHRPARGRRVGLGDAVRRRRRAGVARAGGRRDG